MIMDKRRLVLGGVIALAIVAIFLFLAHRQARLASVLPLDGAVDVPLDQGLQLTFNRALSANSVIVTSQPTADWAPKTSGANSKTLFFWASAVLEASTQYTVTVHVGRLRSTYRFHFTTTTDAASKDEAAITLLGRSDEQYAARQDAYLDAHPLLKHLPPDEPGPPLTLVDYDEAQDSYTFTITMPLNRPMADAEWSQAVDNAKQDALNWVKSIGLDPSKLHIVWKIQT